jgi:translation elongation factor P/translation initiation factor 5A
MGATLRPGMIVRHDGDLYSVHAVEHRTPGNKRAGHSHQHAQPAQRVDHRLFASVLSSL